MNTKVYKFLIYVSAIAIVAVVVGQFLWTRYTHEIVNNNSRTLIDLSLTKTSDDFSRKISHLNIPVDSNNTKDLNCGCDRNVIVHYFAPVLDSLLKLEMKNGRIEETYNYALGESDDIVYKSDTTVANIDYLNAEFRKSLFCGKCPHGLVLYVTFPNGYLPKKQAIHVSFWWLMSMFGFLIIVGSGLVLIRSFRMMKRDSLRRINIINNLAHEFKTPIASIKLGAEMLLNEQINHAPEKVSKYGELIRFEVKRLQHQVEQILNVVLLDEGQLLLRYKYIHVNEVIGDLVEKYLIVRSDLQSHFKLELLAKNDIIYADPSHFESVIINLIENAVKYGGDEVNVEISTGNRGQETIITIADDGPGIPRKFHKMVFERYFRINPGNRHDIKGHGIGLYYVKSILAKMGADIVLSNNNHKGAKFEITFPDETITH